MKQFRKILLVLDPEAQRQPALVRAAELARLHGASLYVLTVLEDLPMELEILLSKPHPGELWERLEHQQRTRVEALLAPIREQGIRSASRYTVASGRFLGDYPRGASA